MYGPFKVKLLESNIYFVYIFIDEHTRYISIYLIVNKSEVFTVSA